MLTLSCMGAGTKRQQVTEGRLLSYMATPAGSGDPLLSGKSGLRASMFQLDLPAEHPKFVASSMPQGLQRPGHANGAAEDGKAPDGLKVLRSGKHASLRHINDRHGLLYHLPSAAKVLQ